MTLKNSFTIALFIFIGFIGFAQKKEKQKAFRDSIDNAIDLSHFLMDLHGVLPIIMPITEPAVGFGAAVAGLYFLPSVDKKGERKTSDIIAIGGGYTENKTWFTGGSYTGFWKDDHIRYRGILGYGNVNLTYYGLGGGLLEKYPLDYTIQSLFFLQQVVFRIKDSDFFIGGKYQLTKTKATFFKDIDKGLNVNLISSGVGLITEYDNYDNIFSPSKGARIHLSVDQNFEFLGSDLDFTKLKFYGNYYFGKHGFWTPAIRIASNYSSESTPFYAKPYVELRGVPAMRYQGNFTILAETEHEFAINNRWSVVGFTGIGAAYKSIDDLSSGTTAWNAGTGFRYLIARLMGIKMGLDVAKGPEDWGVYVTFGSAWLR